MRYEIHPMLKLKKAKYVRAFLMGIKRVINNFFLVHPHLYALQHLYKKSHLPFFPSQERVHERKKGCVHFP